MSAPSRAARDLAEEREVIKCPHCGLNQYMTRSGLCRKPECGKPLKPAGELSDRAIKETIVVTPAIAGYSRRLAILEKEIIPSLDTARVISEIVSNVGRKKMDMRHQRDSMLIRDVPCDFRQKLIKYCKANKMSLRELVMKSLESYLDMDSVK